MAINKQKTVDKLAMSFEKAKLKVDGKIHCSEIVVPGSKEVLLANAEERKKRSQLKVESGLVIEVEGQEFIGYTASVRNIADVNAAYTEVRARQPQARHVVCACKIPGRNFHTLCDSADDDEHGMGNVLLRMLEEANCNNRAVYVARKYDGTHIGPKRYDAFKDAARSAVTHSPFNHVLGTHQALLSKEEETALRSNRTKTKNVQGHNGERTASTSSDWDTRVTEEVPQ